MAYERVLIVLLGAIGDVVRALPLATRLRAGWPAAKLMWAVEPAAAPIVDRHPALDEVIQFDRSAGIRGFVRFLRVVRAREVDLTLDLQRHFKSGLTSWYSGAAARIGFAVANSREGNWLFNNRHVAPVERFSPKVAQYLSFADSLDVPPAPLSFGLRLQPDEEARVTELLSGVQGRFAALFTGSTWPSRSWFPLPTAALCRALRERGLCVVLIGAPSDGPFAREVVAAGAEVANLVGRTSLRDVIGILARAVIAVGPDSGPMHISAAVGTPVVCLWGAPTPAP
jgi:ADP-heptose:LPS heptosyltransferase